MDDKKIASGGGIGLGGALFLVLLTLKLTGHINTSWLWVSAPLWAPFAFLVAVVLVMLGLYGVAVAADKVRSYRRRH